MFGLGKERCTKILHHRFLRFHMHFVQAVRSFCVLAVSVYHGSQNFGACFECSAVMRPRLKICIKALLKGNITNKVIVKK